MCTIIHSMPQRALFSNQSVLFAIKLCFIFCMAINNPPDTGVTIIAPTDKAVNSGTMELTAISGNRHKYF